MPAPVTAFFRVFIDHGDGPEYFGLYTGMELPSDEAFLDTQLGGHKGNLYKPDGSGATWATYSDNATRPMSASGCSTAPEDVRRRRAMSVAMTSPYAASASPVSCSWSG